MACSLVTTVALPANPVGLHEEHATHVARPTALGSRDVPSGSNQWLLLQTEMQLFLLLFLFLLLTSIPGSWVSAALLGPGRFLQERWERSSVTWREELSLQLPCSCTKRAHHGDLTGVLRSLTGHRAVCRS